jgi:hypothetical protein
VRKMRTSDTIIEDEDQVGLVSCHGTGGYLGGHGRKKTKDRVESRDGNSLFPLELGIGLNVTVTVNRFKSI